MSELAQRFYRSKLNRLKFLVQKYPYRVQCNICGWKGRFFFSDSWHPFTQCPQCGSAVRHRLLFASVTTLADLGIKDIISKKRILHFAPERILSELFKERAGEYVTADFCRVDVDMELDMSDMSGVADNSFDVVLACDVLEHIPDDSAALREIYRILSFNGWAILTVPQKDGLPTKYEDPSITTPEGRKQAFGLEEHLRIYGDDFAQVLENHGFTVTVVDERNFDSKMVRKNVLAPPSLSVHPLATNHRKVYFAQKRLAPMSN